MKKTKRWTCNLCQQDTGYLWAMLLFLILAYGGPALWSMYRVADGSMPPALLLVVAVVLAFSARLGRPIWREIARRPWTPLFRRDRAARQHYGQ